MSGFDSLCSARILSVLLNGMDACEVLPEEVEQRCTGAAPDDSEAAGLVVGCCEGCDKEYVVDGLSWLVDEDGSLPEDPLLECDDCGCSLYVCPGVLVDNGDTDVDELPDVLEPISLADAAHLVDCVDCLASGDECEFHAGLAVGWDLAVAHMAQHIERERTAELTAGQDLLAEVAEGRR